MIIQQLKERIGKRILHVRVFTVFAKPTIMGRKEDCEFEKISNMHSVNSA